LFAVSAGKKQPKQVGKMPEICKKFNFKVVMIFFNDFQKNFSIMHKIQVSDFLIKSYS